jgi:thioredoxin-related protein|uniref:thioredoxin family protein n=1 Tax=Polaribacter sp. TaxID=1920175 RepID=UPI004047D976
MKKITLILFLGLLVSNLSAQTEKVNLYNPEANAKMDIEKAVAKAKKEGKNVMIQAGGNWCGWCILFDKKVKADPTLKKALDDNYVSYHLNYSQENQNTEVFASLGYPERFGFPVFIILDANGKRLHTQNSAYLEEGKGHSASKILEFFKHWTVAAVHPTPKK